ncbi:MAG TPA: type II toxin-antitoxin system Phd/YefM family antitoxin [Terracidiphilus sp.]|jgi:antitoxin (DNA-binding transcriptional repressor) of toxin-antitoxin stability system|nr:type II toxin-antitoxin system Phd/YefM family antitoxin [Terracidiphilus sp.]
MRSVSISVTEASRNFADCVDRARYQGTAFLLHKNGVAVARIVPVGRDTHSMDELDAAASGNGAEEKAAESEQNAGKVPGVRAVEIW